MDRNQKLLSNTILYTIGGIGAKLITFLLVPLYTRYMATSEYGIADLYYLAIQIFVTVGTLKIASSLARYAVADMQNAGKYLTNAIIIVTASSLICAVIYHIFVKNIFLVADLNDGYFILFFLAFGIRELLYEMAKAVDKNRLYIADSMLFAMFLLGATVAFVVFLKRGVRGYVESYIVANLASVIILSIGLKIRDYVSAAYIKRDLLIEMMKYSSLLVPATLSFWVIQSSDRYMINYFEGSSSAGIYGVAYKIPSICGMFVNFFMSAWYITAVRNENDKEYSASVYAFYFKVVIVASSIVIIISKLLAYLMFREEFFAAWVYVPVLVFAFVFQYLFQFLEIILISYKSTASILVSFVAGATMNIVLNLLLIPIYGIFGAVIATLISNFLVFVIRQGLLQRREAITVNYKTHIVIILAELVIAVLISLDNGIYTIIAGLLFVVIVYFCRDVFAKVKDRLGV